MDTDLDSLLQSLTPEQKVQLVSGLGMNLDRRNPRPWETVPGAAGYTFPIEDLALPSIVLADGPAGIRIWPRRQGETRRYHATAFPIATLLASTWDPELLEAVGRAIGREARAYGVDVWLGPGLNIHRNPLGGRNFEYFSEDPWLSGHMAAAIVRGVQSEGVGATPKHYVANNQETNRITVDAVVDGRALREIYLRGFEIVVREAAPWSLMSAYNQVNGCSLSEHRPLLTTVLRAEWGFEGVVMTDWYGGFEPLAQMNAGNELLMPGQRKRTAALLDALRDGTLDPAVLDRNVARILALVRRSPRARGATHDDQPDLAAGARIARNVAAQGAVLLRNEAATLPIASGTARVAVFGIGSYDFVSGGTGSGDVYNAHTVSLVEGLESAQFRVDAGLRADYEQHLEAARAALPQPAQVFELPPPLPEMPLSGDQLDIAVRGNDIALLTLGRISGEFQDRALEGDFLLTAAEQAMIADVSRAFHAAGKRVVVILNIGNVIEVASWRDQVDAILLVWQGGQEAGHAVVDVLTGRVDPSGRLPTSFPVRYEDVPSASSFPGTELPGEPVSFAGGLLTARPARAEYREGIYVGYRYYDTFGVEPAWEFGFGLSYTTFECSALTLDDSDVRSGVQVSVDVTNTGARSGRQVVQLYLSAPTDRLHKPMRELKGFARTGMLEPGASQRLSFALPPITLASFHVDRGAWIACPGDYTVGIGSSSRRIALSGDFRLADEIVVADGLIDLAPALDFEPLAP